MTSMTRLLAVLGGSAACVATAPRGPDAAEADRSGRVYVGPMFWSGEEGAPDYAAVEVDADGIVVALHRVAPPPRPEGAVGPERVTLPGALATPGLIDAHLHLTWIGRVQEWVQLDGARSPAEVAARVADHVAAQPELTVVTGKGWDQNLFADGAFPTAADLGPGERLVVLSRVDGHALWVNGVGLARVEAHVAAHGEQPGERYLRDAAGALTGVVIDPSPTLRAALDEAPSADDRARWLARALATCADAGLVGVHDMATTVDELEALLALGVAAGRLPVRVAVYLEDAAASWAWLERRAPATPAEGAGPVWGRVTPHPDVTVLGVKLFADGALGSRGAALKADYSDEPGHRGQPAPLAPLMASARRAGEQGLQLAVHAIGDLGNAHALALIAVAEEHGAGRRHRVEHAQVVDPADWERFVSLGAVASMQPTHATSDMGWAAARLGEERLLGAYAWRSALTRGVPLAFGSDAPIESPRPAHGIHAAVTRQGADGEPEGGWRPEEGVTVAEAVAAFTAGAAYAAHEEGARGRLAVGRPLDLTVFDRDPRGEPSAWRAARPTATVVDGRVRPVGSDR